MLSVNFFVVCLDVLLPLALAAIAALVLAGFANPTASAIAAEGVDQYHAPNC